MDEERHVVVEIGKGDAIFRSHRLADDDFVDIVELVPVLVAQVVILDERLELRSARNRHVECFGREEAFRVEQVEEVVVDEVREKLIRQAVERRHLRQGEVPLAEC